MANGKGLTPNAFTRNQASRDFPSLVDSKTFTDISYERGCSKVLTAHQSGQDGEECAISVQRLSDRPLFFPHN